MRSELDEEFIELFAKLPERVQKAARKNYQLWQQDPNHPSLEFKKVNAKQSVYSIRVGIGWRAVGVKQDSQTIIWFWIGSHGEYDNLLKEL